MEIQKSSLFFESSLCYSFPESLSPLYLSHKHPLQPRIPSLGWLTPCGGFRKYEVIARLVKCHVRTSAWVSSTHQSHSPVCLYSKANQYYLRVCVCTCAHKQQRSFTAMRQIKIQHKILTVRLMLTEPWEQSFLKISLSVPYYSFVHVHCFVFNNGKRRQLTLMHIHFQRYFKSSQQTF